MKSTEITTEVKPSKEYIIRYFKKRKVLKSIKQPSNTSA